ncbi:dynamin family protein [Streptomyces syringium]|uniref:dynamin family protein n=1 Tax=Streptomyces syringium TaxID=76729 RepID=UPI003D8DAAFA
MRDNAFGRLRADVLAAFPRLTEELSDELGPRGRERLERSRARLERGTCHVVVGGEFKHGKSTLLNALVERPGLFPVDADVATNVVCTLAWGPRERARVHLGDPASADGAGRHTEIGLADLGAYVTEQGNPRNHKRVRLVEVRAPVPRLASGLVLVDTPGVGSVDPEHTAATRSFLDRADGLVFACDALDPLTTYELDFLDEALKACDVVIVAVTKTDKVRDASPLVNDAREKIAARTGRPAGSLVVVPVSAFRKLTWLRHRQRAAGGEGDRTDDRLLAESGFPELDHVMWGGLATAVGAVQLRRALDGLADALATAGSPAANELAALESDESLRRLRHDIAGTTARIERLTAGGAEWRTELRRRFELDNRRTRTGLQEAFDAVSRRYQEAVAGGCDPGSEELAGEVAAGMLHALTEAHERLATVAVTLMREFAERTSLRLTPPEVPPPPFTPAVTVPTVPLGVRPARAFDLLRSGWSTGMAGLGAGGLVGFVEPVTGFTVAACLGVTGVVQGIRNHREDLRERAERERAARLFHLVNQEIAANRRHATEAFHQAYGDTAQTLTQELGAQLGAQRESLAESGRRLQEATSRTEGQLAGRRGELLARQQRHRLLQGELDRLRSRIEQTATSPLPPPLPPRPPSWQPTCPADRHPDTADSPDSSPGSPDRSPDSPVPHGLFDPGQFDAP